MEVSETDKMQFLEQAVELEHNVGRLYSLYHHMFPDDADFWWQLSLEEGNHAALLKSGMTFLGKGIFPYELLYPNLEQLLQENTCIKELIKRHETHSPSRKEAFDTAYSIENSAYELHFQHTMERKENRDETYSELFSIFKQLNQADRDHASRIQAYMLKHGMVEE
jgi:hypothetical protein